MANLAQIQSIAQGQFFVKDSLGNLREPLIINYQEHFSNLSRNFS